MAVDARLAYSLIQDKTNKQEPINQKLLDFKKNEDIPFLIKNICKGLEIIDGFTLKDVIMRPVTTIFNRETTHERLNQEGKKKGYISYPIEESRFNEVIIKYHLKGTNQNREIEEKDCTKKLYYPELLEGQYFELNGSRFFPVMQLANAEFYRTMDNSIVLKTMFMPLKIRGEQTKLKDDEGKLGREGYPTLKLNVYLFKKYIPFFRYYFAKFGLEGSLEAFNMADAVDFIIDENKNIVHANPFLYFKLTKKITMRIDREWFDADPDMHAKLIQAIISVFSKKIIKPDKMLDTAYWKNRLGREFTTNTNTADDKATSIMLSLERIMNDSTRDTLRIPDEEKKDVYTIMRYMIYNFDRIVRIDNHDLANKRIRVAEYLLYPLTAKLSKAVYRLVNSKHSRLGDLENIFSNIPASYIMNHIATIPLLRYSNGTSTLDLFNSTLKGSKNGPQAEKSAGTKSLASKGINPSYLGEIDTTATSSGDPGSSVTIVPTAKVYDPNGTGAFFFTDQPEYNLPKTLEQQNLEDDNDFDMLDDIMDADDDLMGDDF